MHAFMHDTCKHLCESFENHWTGKFNLNLQQFNNLFHIEMYTIFFFFKNSI